MLSSVKRFPQFTNALLVGCVLVAMVLVGWVFYSRAAFGSWNPLAPPNRIGYCDRTYYPGGHVTRAQLEAQGNGLDVFPITQVGQGPAGQPIYARPLPGSVRHQFPNGPPLPCAMVVYLKVGADDYLAYGISGGP